MFRCRKGSVLLYVLVFFSVFLLWFEVQVRTQIQDLRRRHFVQEIERRLEMEAEIIAFYRGNQGDSYDFSLGFVSVVSYREANTIYVIASGDIRMRFKYDIIEDGSFIHSHWEE